MSLQILNDSILQVQEWSIPVHHTQKNKETEQDTSLSKQKTYEGATVQKEKKLKWKRVIFTATFIIKG